MKKAIWFISYRLVDGASVQDFLQASKETHDEVLSKKKGFISWQVLSSGDTWVDLCTWESVDDARNAEKDEGEISPIAVKFYSYIDMNSLQSRIYTVEKSY